MAACGWVGGKEGPGEQAQACAMHMVYGFLIMPMLCPMLMQATLRCFPFDQPAGPHTCLMTGQPAKEVAIFAKAY